jgi:hypothetical protein
MNIKFTLFLLLLSSFTFAQESALFDRNFHHRTDDQESKNRREYVQNDSLIAIKDFYENGLVRTGEFYGFTDLKNLDEFIWYNANRQYDKSPDLKIENREGVVKYYDKNGAVTSEQIFREDDVKYIQFWNNSIPCLVYGTGKLQSASTEKNEVLVRIFKDSVETEGYIIRELKNDTIYYKTDTHAYPKTGLQAFYKDLAENVSYPGFANLLGIDKKITIEFIVDEEGNLIDFEPLNNKSLNFEKKAIKKLEKMPKWIPATLNGRNVKTRFRIPLTFKN